MREMRLVFAAATFVAAVHAAPAGAIAYSNDQSDLWWNPSESGWGIQLVQRGAVIYGTMFVYAQDGSPTWYSAAMLPVGAGTGEKAATLAWSGDLGAYRGTWFGAPNFTGATAAKVGTMTWASTGSTTGTLTYSVNGQTVTKQLVRQLIVVDDFSGAFMGGIHVVQSNCTNPAKNETFDDFATLQLSQANQAIALTIVSATTGLNCTFSGPLTQAGRLGASDGTFNCSGKVTNGSLSGLVVGIDSLRAHFSNTDPGNGCVSTGYFAGALQ